MRTIYRDIVGAFIFSHDGKLVVGKNAGGGAYENSWVIPGGGIEPGETEVEALIREVQEEVGLNIKDASIEKTKGTSHGESEKTLRDSGERVLVKMTFHNFIVRIAKDASEITLIDGDGFEAAKWLTEDEFSSTTFSPPTIVTLKELGYLL